MNMVSELGKYTIECCLFISKLTPERMYIVWSRSSNNRYEEQLTLLKLSNLNNIDFLSYCFLIECFEKLCYS